MNKVKWMMLLFILALVVTILLVLRVKMGEGLVEDEILSQFLIMMFPEATIPFFNVITELGDKIGIGIVALIMFLWLGLKKRDYKGIVILLLAVALGNEMSKWIKDLVGRERPATAELAQTLSFPSGHAMVGFILYFISAYFLINHFKSVKLKWGTGIVAVILILLIGLSRIVLQDHYPTDVLGGFAVGMMWSILWLFLYYGISTVSKARQVKKGTKSYPLNQ